MPAMNDDAVHLLHRVAAIAGKPCSYGGRDGIECNTTFRFFTGGLGGPLALDCWLHKERSGWCFHPMCSCFCSCRSFSACTT
ncbi:hypothetical protein C1Y08_24150 [Pseudomonas sp. FW306-02-F02-AA]|nr:hypothetical protein C1Y07_26080 [Pseudomonas sp. FW306-02-F02-AB]PMZ07683.1 hypothetical protein C1Y06_23545 [Pseudomonas sp. FW306-02-H06C]PMZ13401.1 hypothetical protein C1Y08_24150 [Pseudomonas sp. FW306-02-F02-AA]PMZ19550.1 hypothetical protein C1Y09_23285 [Pseudomonas sp. FW306-02-F08-AA]PMZ25274.1 hypothetical protein C1Y05_24585 [Pseudomonas sp. FW306-02-F04-BA]PMZ32036.1 hypothetical protein C1X99_23615 [Pseudomonas sp. FW306-02-H06B]PMZ38225.1 hypothetical protein C1Y00_22700 [Ps